MHPFYYYAHWKRHFFGLSLSLSLSLSLPSLQTRSKRSLTFSCFLSPFPIQRMLHFFLFLSLPICLNVVMHNICDLFSLLFYKIFCFLLFLFLAFCLKCLFCSLLLLPNILFVSLFSFSSSRSIFSAFCFVFYSRASLEEFILSLFRKEGNIKRKQKSFHWLLL